MSGAAQEAGSEPETLSTERVLLTSTQEDGRERRDSRGGKLRGRLAVEEALPQAGQRRGGGRAGAPQEGRGPRAGALLTGSGSRHSGFSWQCAKRTHRWATVRARGGAQGSTTSGRGLVLSLLGTGLAWDRRVRRAFSDPRAGPAPSRTFPKPTAGVRRRWGKGCEGSRAFTHMCSQREIHMQTYSWIHTLT